MNERFLLVDAKVEATDAGEFEASVWVHLADRASCGDRVAARSDTKEQAVQRRDEKLKAKGYVA